MEACEQPRRLELTIRETEASYARGQGVPPHDTCVDIALTTVGDQTDATIEVRGMPSEKVAFYGVGWQVQIENLAR